MLASTDIGEYGQFWLGAETKVSMSEMQFKDNPYLHIQGQGEWWWPHKNESVGWFDWAQGQPDNFHGEDCVVMREYHNPLLPILRDYFWNDYGCRGSAHYICENTCRP